MSRSVGGCGYGRPHDLEFIDTLTDEDTAEVAASMAEVRELGLSSARHVRGPIYEVKAEARDVTIRLLFAREGTRGQVLLALEGFSKKTQNTPERSIRLAEARLGDWRSRARRS